MLPKDVYFGVVERKKGKTKSKIKEGNLNLEGEYTCCGKEKKCGETLLGVNVDLFRLLYNFNLLAIRTQ